MKKIFTLIATALFALGANAQSTDVVELSAATLDTENSINTKWCFKGTDITIVPDGGRDVKVVYCPEGSTAETGGYAALNVKNNTKQTISLPTGVKLYRIQITGFSQGDNFDYIYGYGAGEKEGGYEWVDPIGTGIKDNAKINSDAKYPIDPCGFKGTRVAESTRECGYIIADIDFGEEPYEGSFDLICSGNNQADLNYKLFLSRAAADAATTGISTVKAATETNSAIFNVAGQQVSKNYKGLVIKNGKKIIQK